jgi:hypothetical protein
MGNIHLHQYHNAQGRIVDESIMRVAAMKYDRDTACPRKRKQSVQGSENDIK